MTTPEAVSQVQTEVKDRILYLTLNNEAKRNPLSEQALSELLSTLDNAKEDPSLRIIILRSTGPVFSAGHDLREMIDRSEEEYARLFDRCTQVMESIRLHPLPVLAEVAGMATAAGCQLVTSCDLIVASEDATFATPGVKIGLFCSTPAVALARALPTKKAMEMLLTGEPITAPEALRLGMVNQVVPRPELAAASYAMAQKIIRASRYTLALGKRVFYEQLALDRPAAYRCAQAAMIENALAPDGQEGMRAFLEKREPRWQP